MALSSELKDLLSHALPDALVGDNRLVAFLDALDSRVAALEKKSATTTTTVAPSTTTQPS